MKKYIFCIVAVVSILLLNACGKKDTYEIEILVPAGSQENFVYSDEEISPLGKKITISSSAGLSDTEVILKPVDETMEFGYVAEYLTRGMPVEFDTTNSKGEWFKIGVAVQNDSEKGPIAVSVMVEGVEVRIAERVEAVLKATILDVKDGYFFVKPIEGSSELNSADQIEVPMQKMAPSPEPEVDDMIEISYSGEILETYPARLSKVYGIKVIEEKKSLSLNDVIILSQKGRELTWFDFEQYRYIETGSGLYIRVYEINERFRLIIGGAGPQSEPMYIYLALNEDNGPRIDIRDGGVTEFISAYNESDEDETIIYNGKEYKKSELCDATLHWLELSEKERMLSSYLPPEFLEFTETWGITLNAVEDTPTGMTLECRQNGGEPTGELQTGSWYIVERWTKENGWQEAEYVIDGNMGWTEEAWMIPMESTTTWEVDWNWLYGELSDGKYRIGKEIMDFRGTGDYDTAIYFAEFEIE